METREELRQRVHQEQKISARLRTAATRFDDSQTERNWAIVSAHRAGLSIRQIALAAGLSSSRVHQLLKEVDATEIPEWLSQVRHYDGQSGEDGKEESTNPETKIRARVAAEATILRQCIHWLEQLDRGEMVTVNLRPETEEEPEFVSFDRQRVLKVLNRIAADLDDFSQRSAEEMKGSIWLGEELDSQARHRRQLAEPPPKGPSQRDQRAALRAKLGLPLK